MTGLTISQQLELAVTKYKTKPALGFPAEQITLDYISLKEQIDQTSKALLGIGLKKGDHIGIWSTNSSRWILLALGAAQIGVVFVPINAAYKREELTYLVRTMDINCLFTMDQLRGASCANILECFYENEQLHTGSFPMLRNIYSMSEAPAGRAKSWNTFLQHTATISNEQLKHAKALVSDQDIYSMQPTSGTTALPKGARLYQYGVLYTADCYAKLLHLNEADVCCVPLPRQCPDPAGRSDFRQLYHLYRIFFRQRYAQASERGKMHLHCGSAYHVYSHDGTAKL